MTGPSPEEREALAGLRRHSEGLELRLVGAAAVAVQADILIRKTQDVDIAVLCKSGQTDLTEKLRSDGWIPSSSVPHRWVAPSGARLDILVFSPDDLASGTMPTGGDREMGLVGFDLAMEHPVEVNLDDAGRWKAARLPVIALLKAAAYLDRPADRRKDLIDIAFLLDRYREDDVWGGPETVEYESACAFLLGTDLRPLCRDVHSRLLREFVNEAANVDGGPHQVMIQSGPGRISSDPEILAGQLAAFATGAGLEMQL